MSAIFADTKCDLEKSEVKKININLVNLDEKDLTQAFKKAFQPYLDEEEDIIYLATDLSQVKSNLDESLKYFNNLYERRVIKVIDLNTFSVNAGLVVYEAGLMYKRGCTDLEILNFVDKFKNECYGLLISQNKDFILNNCSGLDKVNKNSTFNLINPIVFVKGANFEIIDKAQGKKKAINNIVNWISDCTVNIADYPLIIGYTDDKVNAEYLKNSLNAKLGEDAIVLLQKFSEYNENLFGKSAIMVSFYSKKILKTL